MAKIPEKDWEWLGHAAHFIVADRCLFHLATKVGKYLISTVGDYHPDMNRVGEELGKRETIRAGKRAFFETYVFSVGKKLDCGCYALSNAGEIDGTRWETAAKATAGHRKFCRKYALKGKNNG